MAQLQDQMTIQMLLGSTPKLKHAWWAGIAAPVKKMC